MFTESDIEAWDIFNWMISYLFKYRGNVLDVEDDRKWVEAITSILTYMEASWLFYTVYMSSISFQLFFASSNCTRPFLISSPDASFYFLFV